MSYFTIGVRDQFRSGGGGGGGAGFARKLPFEKFGGGCVQAPIAPPPPRSHRPMYFIIVISLCILPFLPDGLQSTLTHDTMHTQTY